MMGCCVICMMGFGFNLVEVLWVGSRLVCVAGAGVWGGGLLVGIRRWVWGAVLGDGGVLVLHGSGVG